MDRRKFLATSPFGFCLFGLISGEKIEASDIEKLNPNQRLCFDYLTNVFAYLGMARLERLASTNPTFTYDLPFQPDERLMRGIEEKIDIPEQGCDDFRRQIAAYIGHVMWHGRKFDWDSLPELKKAFELYMKENNVEE